MERAAALDAHLAPGRPALLLLSGGRDSAWCAWFLRHRFPRLDFVALTVDTGFMAPCAMTNAHRVVAALGLRHVILRPDLKPVLRAAFLDMADKGGAMSVDLAEGTAVFELGAELAQREGVSLISGLTEKQIETYGPTDTFCPRVIWPRPGRQMEREIAYLRLQSNPLRTNSRLMAPLLVLDVRRRGASSFRDFLASPTARAALYGLEALARIGVFDKRADRVLAELGLSLEQLCLSR